MDSYFCSAILFRDQTTGKSVTQDQNKVGVSSVSYLAIAVMKANSDDDNDDDNM